jgi:hypothetical protein
MLADEMPNARFVAARDFLEWRTRPERLDQEAIRFVAECWATRAERRTDAEADK